MKDDYDVVMPSTVVEHLMICTQKTRQNLLDRLNFLASNPSTKGQRTVHDLSGRQFEVLVVGQWEITYWPDHAVKELRIVRLRKT